MLHEIGKKEDSEKIMEEVMTLAPENEFNNYAYQLLGAREMDKAVDVLTLNTERFPKSANAWDSLGQALH